MSQTTIFSPASILLPIFTDDSERMKRWAVIACDQFTSDPAYWQECRHIIGDAPSAYRYFMPEAYLDTEWEAQHAQTVQEAMSALDEEAMRTVNGMIYLERTLPNGSIRHGLIGKIDLEQYDYAVGSQSPIRATEATVIERIPPRCRIRAEAAIELPHILILIDDKNGVFAKAEQLKSQCRSAYDFDLMLGGGHVHGYELTGNELNAMLDTIAEYEKSAGSVVYAMGDGNHSLAAAKAHWETCKKAGAGMDHPARYALCEITALGEDSLVFEPIYRVLKNCDPLDVLASLQAVAKPGDREPCITVLTGTTEQQMAFVKPTHALTVGTLQNFLDDYVKARPGVTCDYIHGEDSVRTLAADANTVGFLMNGMDKHDLFPYVEVHGTLPRKTFSMGEAESKRYYIESRRIVK